MGGHGLTNAIPDSMVYMIDDHLVTTSTSWKRSNHSGRFLLLAMLASDLNYGKELDKMLDVNL